MISLIDATEFSKTFMLPDATSSVPALASSPWRQSSTEALSALRFTLQRAIGFSTGTGRKSRDVQKRFGVDFKLSWQVYRVVSEGNALACGPDVPPPTAMKRLLIALRQHAVPEPHVAAVEAAFDAFEGHVAITAGDRDTFNAMIANLMGGDTSYAAELVHRRASFDAQRYLYGTEQSVFISSYILAPNGNPFRGDLVRLSHRNRLIRLNFSAPISVERNTFDTLARTPEESIRLPLDPDASAKYHIPLLPAFCSNVNLPLREMPNNKQMVIEWGEGIIGSRSAVDLSFGFIDANIETVDSEGNSGVALRTHISTPTRRAVFDLFLHRPSYKVTDYEAIRWGRVSAIPDVDVEAAGFPRLPCYEQIEFMGGGASAAHLVDTPSYVPMLEFACQRMNWRLDDFDLYRIAVDFPFVDTLLVRKFGFPKGEKPVSSCGSTLGRKSILK